MLFKLWRKLIRQRIAEGYRFEVAPNGSMRVWYPNGGPNG
jgi:hypothetical protein